jgi:outer membrane protein assembly factor BamB
MRIAIALCALGTGCVTAEPDVEVPNPREPYDMVKTKSIAGELPVFGVDGDGAGGLWILYFATWSDEASVVHLDENGAKLAEHRWYADFPPSGIARDGDTLWINDPGINFESPKTVRQIDGETGDTLRTVTLDEHQVVDIDVFDDELRLGTFDGRVIALDRASGVETWRGTLIGAPDGYTGTSRGFTTDDDGAMWVMSSGYWLEKYTPDFAGAGVFRAAPFEGHHTTAFEVFLAWDGGLIAATENQISWLVPRGDL